MKNIFLDFHGKKHSLYDNLIKYPPEDCQFYSGVTPLNKFIKKASTVSFLPKLLMNSANQIIPISILKPYLDKNSKLPQNINLIYSSGHIILKNMPWVVDLEFVTHLSGYSPRAFRFYKNIIRKSLESDNCKKIMPWTDAGSKTVLMSFDSDKIREKVQTVHLAVPPKKFQKKYDDDKIKILFVGSQNLPKDFDIKGGKEVFKAFEQLIKDYDNIELTVRSFVPNHIKNKYSTYKNIKIIDQVVPWNIVENEFMTSDIFLFPSYNTPGLALLDAMSYELPIITTDVWANSEMIKDKENGVLINKSNKINFYDDHYVPTWSSPSAIKIIKSGYDPKVVEDIVDKIKILIEDKNYRKKMGMAGRILVEEGEFSIKHRNIILKTIIESMQ